MINMTQKKARPVVNLLDLRAVRRIEWEENEEGRVSLLVPRFRHPFLVRHITPRLKSPNITVKLDTFGSFVWKQCDGTRTVGEVAESLQERFGDEAAQAYERVALFIKRLRHEKFVELEGLSRRG
jgi:hypothetical protein